MADLFPTAPDNSPINLNCTRPLRGKKFSIIMKQKGKEIKAKQKSHTPSASSAPLTSKNAASSAPSMLLTRADAAKNLQEAVTGGGGGGLEQSSSYPERGDGGGRGGRGKEEHS